MQEHQELYRGEKPNDRRLSDSEVHVLLQEYGSRGLKEDGEFFVIRYLDGSGNEVRFHKWKTIPHTEDGGKTVSSVPIKEHIEKHLIQKFRARRS